MPFTRTTALLLIAVVATPVSGADDAWSLRLSAPIDRWDEAIPLGNGLTGGLLWGGGSTINLSLDRGDLWDERLPALYGQPEWNYETIKRLKAAGDQAEISRLFDAPYHEAAPTKLPGGRLVLDFEPDRVASAFALDLRRAIGRAELSGGALECFFSATDPVAMLRVEGAAPAMRIVRPAGLDRLGYEPGVFGGDEGDTWLVQTAALGLTYAVVARAQRVGDATIIAVAITSTRDGDDPLEIGRRRVADALEAGYATMLAPHLAWWSEFWSISGVDLPNARLQRHYNLVKYFCGAASRRGAPPMPLQGVWTADEGNLPPWKGDYHHDLNTQMTYLAVHAAGLTDSGLGFIDYNWDLLPQYRAFCASFYGVEGAAVPGVATLGGRPTGGWSQYALSPTNALWIGHSFYLHWRHTMSRAFLEERAYPWLSEIATGVANLLEDRDGRLSLPLSSSPEIHDNSLRAWLEPNSNYDLALMRWAFRALAEMAGALDRPLDAARWRDLRDRLDDSLVDEQGVLMFARNEPFATSHRHHSHTMAIHPLGLLTVEGEAPDRAVINATLDRMIDLGTQAWVGYSFSWFSCMLARCGRADEALHYLEDYERAFTLRNGFHANGDQIGAGLSGFRYRPFTLEGNFLAMQAVHEMLLQSWGDRVRVFPAAPHAWDDVAFDRLRAEGGFVVSAERRGGLTTRVEIAATVDGRLRLHDPFGGRAFRASRDVERVGDELRCALPAGERLELTDGPPPSSATPLNANVKPRRETVSLAGAWRIRLDPDARGERHGWFSETFSEETIELPGTTDLAGIGHPLDAQSMTYPVEFERSQFPGVSPAERADEAGHLVRDRLYIGKAWYQRDLVVPPAWTGRHVELFLERTIWRTDVWLDDRYVGGCDSLVAPHRVDLGVLAPGPHRLTIRVDNGQVHDIGIIGHAYGPETQSRWNGIVGRIELIVTPPVRMRRVGISPSAGRASVRVRAVIDNELAEVVTGALELTIREVERTGRIVGSARTERRLAPGRQVVEVTVHLDEPARAWHEFDTTRYALDAALTTDRTGSDDLSLAFGFRDVRRDGRHVVLNGRRILLRGTLDCCVYPRTGHPPTSVDEWLRVLGTIRDHGFNHVRFHTWCPPEAAFEAADRLGLYLQPETPFWVDNWTSELGMKPPLLGGDEEVTTFIRNELRRMNEAYGNHPSFLLACVGNEFGHDGDWALAERIVEEARRADPRRLYAASTARKLTAADDFWITHSTGDAATRGVGPAGTAWDFDAAFATADVPVIAHETGQRPVFPNYARLLPKFDGPLEPLNLARLRDDLVRSGMADQIDDFERASARFQALQYKAEHEGLRRTDDAAGYQLLMLNDFTGQSEALVGVLDPFWESRGVVGAEAIRRWNAPTAVLARFERYVWTTGETFNASIEISHFGVDDVAGAVARWSLCTADGAVFAGGELPGRDVPVGGLTALGRMEAPLAGLRAPAKLTLRVQAAGATNEWDLWVYPPPGAEPDHAGVTIVHRLDDATLDVLRRGGRVLLLAHGLESPGAARTGFLSVYWSAAWWGDRFSSLGILCDPHHPALAHFPNDGHGDWQLHELAEGATTIAIEAAPPGFRPIVQAVPDFHYNEMLAHVFETKVGPGRLLVCGDDLTTDLERRHAARAFRRSLLEYAASDAFAPAFELDVDALVRTLSPMPSGATQEPRP